MTRVFNRERTCLDPVLRPIERLIYRLTGVDEEHEMRWTEYAVAMLLFSVVSMLVLYVMQRLQALLPLNPQDFGAVSPPDLAFNTAASFTTNTNWQAYSGESTMSYFTQMAGLAYHNFVSAAVGIALAIAFIRGIAADRRRHDRQLLGRPGPRARCGCCCRSASSARLLLVSQGVVQNLRPTTRRRWSIRSRCSTGRGRQTGDHEPSTEQTIAQGPVASQEIIKQFGTNGGGFFNANSAHPVREPDAALELPRDVRIFAISAGLTYTLGRMTGSQRARLGGVGGDGVPVSAPA